MKHQWVEKPELKTFVCSKCGKTYGQVPNIYKCEVKR